MTIHNMETKDLSNYRGFLKIWRFNDRGEKDLILHKNNTILYRGSDILARALVGKANSKITHMYIGFTNSVDDDFYDDVVPVTKDYSVPFSTYSSSDTPPRGYLRIPLTFPASFLNESNYDNNIAVFTTQIVGANEEAGGADFTDVSPESRIFSCALVAGGDTVAQDVVFSHINFTPIAYNSSYNLSLSWGVRFSS